MASITQISCTFAGHLANLIVVLDIGEQQRLERHVQFLVRHDVLTALPNRTEFRDRLVGAMARARRNARQVTVMLINIDYFKGVNTKYGSSSADLVLQELALRMTRAIRQADSAARIAGDEFALILEAIDERGQAAVVANRVLARVKVPFQIVADHIEVTASAGVAAFPSDLETLVRMADVAMYAAKESGRGAFRLYFPEFEERSRRDQSRHEQTVRRMATLTERVREVMDVLVEGNSSMAIAYLLGASPRTIANYRAKVMAKMQADSLPDLVRMVLVVNQKTA